MKSNPKNSCGKKPKKLKIKSISINYGDGKWVDLNDNEYKELIFWNIKENKWDSNNFILIPKKWIKTQSKTSNQLKHLKHNNHMEKEKLQSEFNRFVDISDKYVDKLPKYLNIKIENESWIPVNQSLKKYYREILLNAVKFFSEKEIGEKIS